MGFIANNITRAEGQHLAQMVGVPDLYWYFLEGNLI